MGYTSGDSTAFARAKEAAAGLLASVRPQDRCTIVTTSAPRASVLHEVEGTRRDELLDRRQFAAALGGARVVAGRARRDWTMFYDRARIPPSSSRS